MADVQTEADVVDFLWANRILLVSSSNVAWIAYDWQKQTFMVRFLNGAQWEYGFFDVDQAYAFATAESKGGFVWDHIRVRGKGGDHRHQPHIFAVQHARGS